MSVVYTARSPFAIDAGICTALPRAGTVRTPSEIWSQARLGLISDQLGLPLQHCQAFTEISEAVFVPVLTRCPSAAREAKAIA